MPSFVVENLNFEPYKPKRQYNLYSSLLPILLSIFIYILCFYVLDVSLSSIFNDTKILFVISNALIIIIAADYGAKVPERTIRVVSENHTSDVAIKKYEPVTEQSIHITAAIEETCNARNLVNSKPYGRSKSNKARGRVSVITKEHRQEIKNRPKSYDRSQSDSSKWMVVHKGKKAEEMEEATEKWENVREESEEFSKMSNEELNRRVEDFIQRFNRDIKR